MKDKIDEMREKLHKEIQSKNSSHERIVEMSECLDKLIIEYYEEENKVKRKQ